MAILTFDFEVPDEVAQTVASLPDKQRAEYLARVNAFAVATLSNNAQPDLYADYNGADEPLDEAFIAELIAADEEYIRNGRKDWISLEDLIAQNEDISDVIKRGRARLAAEGRTAAQAVGADRASVPTVK